MIRVLNTRPREQAAALSELLRAAGYEPLEVPLVELFLLSEALPPLRKMSDRHFDGVLISSPNLLPLLQAHGESLPAAWLAKPWYLIGPRARPEAESLGAKIAFVPGAPSLAGFLEEIPIQSGLRLIHPCSAKTRLEPALFAAKGINVHNLAVYEPRCPEGTGARLEAAWPTLRAVLFASGSAVHHLFECAPEAARRLQAGFSNFIGPVPLSIGPSTSRALRMHGVEDFRQTAAADNAGFIDLLDAVLKKNVRQADPDHPAKNPTKNPMKNQEDSP